MLLYVEEGLGDLIPTPWPSSGRLKERGLPALLQEGTWGPPLPGVAVSFSPGRVQEALTVLLTMSMP